MIPGIVAGQMLLAGGGSAGAWDPVDVSMGVGSVAFTFADANARMGNPFAFGTNAKGTARNTTSKTSGKRYVEIKLHTYGGFPIFGLAWGFSSTPDSYDYNWSNSGNKNATWRAPNGTLYSYGTTNSDGSNSGSLILPFGTDDVFQMGIEIGVGLTFFAINGGTPVDVSASVPFTEADVKVFATLGTGPSGDGGSDADLSIFTTAATQDFSAFAGHTAWDD